MSETSFSRHNKIMGHRPRMTPRGYGPFRREDVWVYTLFPNHRLSSCAARSGPFVCVLVFNIHR